MDRIFHARVPLYMFLFIALTGGLVLYFLWQMMPVCATVMLLLLIVAIERVIHTTYTFNAAGELIVSYGRFQKRRIVPVQSIGRVEKLRVLRFGRRCLLTYLLVFYDGEKHITVMPVKEEEFLETLQKRRRG